MSEKSSSIKTSTKSSKKKRVNLSKRVLSESCLPKHSRRHHQRRTQSKSRSKHHQRKKEYYLPNADDTNPKITCTNCLSGIFVCQLMILTVTVIGCGLAAFYSTESMLYFFYAVIVLHLEYLFATFFAVCYSNRHIITFLCFNAFVVVGVEAGFEIYQTVSDLKGNCQRIGCGFVESEFNHRLALLIYLLVCFCIHLITLISYISITILTPSKEQFMADDLARLKRSEYLKELEKSHRNKERRLSRREKRSISKSALTISGSKSQFSLKPSRSSIKSSKTSSFYKRKPLFIVQKIKNAV